jgi:hypothetical protein
MALLPGKSGGLFAIGVQQGIKTAPRTNHPRGDEILPLTGFEVAFKMGVPAQLLYIHGKQFLRRCGLTPRLGKRAVSG